MNLNWFKQEREMRRRRSQARLVMLEQLMLEGLKERSLNNETQRDETIVRLWMLDNLAVMTRILAMKIGDNQAWSYTRPLMNVIYQDDARLRPSPPQQPVTIENGRAIDPEDR